MPRYTTGVSRAAFGLLAFALALSAPAQAQTVGTLEGTVIDADLQTPIPGANVRLEGTSLGAATDVEGTFSFTAPTGEYTVVVTTLGFATYREQVTVQSTATTQLRIQLSTDNLLLDDVVVTGYSNRERRNLATSISSIDGSEFEDVPSTSVDAALQGRSAGVTVLRSSGTPGGGISVRVRGGTSINGSNEPLYVVDGVPVATGNFSALGVGNQGTNALSTLDTQSIESIEILKDAAATAIYGTRAANGVVLITTKRGRAGTTQINFSSSLGSSTIPAEFNVLSGADYIAARNEGVRNQRFDVTLSDAVFNANFPGTREFPFGNPADVATNSNFYEDLKQTGLVQTYRLALNGGTENTRFLVSGTYADEEGALQGSAFERLNGLVNVDHTPNEKTIVSAKASYNRGVSDRIENDNNIYGVLTNALISSPAVTAFDDEGNLTPGSQFGFDNPFASFEEFQESVETKFLGNVSASYEFVPGLRARLSGGLDRLDFKDDRFSPRTVRQGAPQGSAYSSVGLNQRYILEGTLNYRRLFGEVHDLSLLAGSSVEDNQYQQTFSSSSQFATDLLRPVSLGAISDGGSNSTTNSLVSFFGNADYSFASRYLLTANARLDGSSRFGSENRYAFFPGVAVGWNVHEEGFLDGASFLDLFKLRGSVGRTGQQEIGNFASLGLFGFGANYAGSPAAIPVQLANPDLKWETTTQISGGLDFGILDGRVSGVVDAYVKDTDDLLLARPLPLSTGFNSITSNIGSVRNRGIEFQLTTQNVRTRNFSWETTLNLSRNQNRVTGLFEGQQLDTGFASRVQVGEPLGSFFGYVTDGLIVDGSTICTDNTGATCDAGQPYQAGGTSVGDIRFVDFARPCTEADNCEDGQYNVLEPDGRITAEDRRIIGDANPDLFGGFTNAFNIFGFELSTFFQFSSGNDVFNASRQFYEQVGRSFGTVGDINDRIRFNADGSVANADATIPRATFNDPNDNDRDSDFYVEDGSYLRLKTVTVGYNVPTRFLRPAGARSLRIYVLGENLWTTTKYTGLDPEVSTFDGSNTSFGTDFFTYPQTQKFVVGVNVGI